jgi:hypothetical protein
MANQELSRKDGNIEITLSHKAISGFFSKLFFGDRDDCTTITIDCSKQVINFRYSKGELRHLIAFADIDRLIIHQYPFSESNGIEYRVGLILKRDPKYIALYTFSNPIFGTQLFEELETKIFGANLSSQVYSYLALKSTFKF